MTCPFCGSLKTEVNLVKTMFCNDCHYARTRFNNCSRLPANPLYEKLGWQIKRGHPDYSNIKKSTHNKKMGTKNVPYRSTWARDL